MQNLLKAFERRVIKPRLRRLKPWRYVTYGDIRVSYRDHLDGGGRTFGMDYLPLFHDLGMPRQSRVFEWCAGPGFIGFALLGHGFCERLCLADINPEAVEASWRTVAKTDGQSGSPCIALTIWLAFPHPRAGIWSWGILHTSAIFRQVRCASMTNGGVSTENSSLRSVISSNQAE